ncbi:ABC transporter substrate-binding protein [Cyclobacterium amurskyense]|uniref:LysM-repeat protein n=1 Tax=Cyclobacterium amurskyense TaxID=320787 RepID=A0A0H4PC38_9BACT|nr:ABC transporter substrate-binding protein [Cyclobacterium amurskyense]AKP50373.1 LysM-repeat protein [Cyclobacterium amurskyense]
MKITLYFLFLIVPLFTAYSQEGFDQLEQAKKQIQQGNQAEAMELLRPYLDKEKYSSLSDYARYHFARAAYGNRQFELAKEALNSLIATRGFAKKDDARYLLALCHFELSSPNDALRLIDQISDETLKKEGYKASYNFLKVSASSSLAVQYGLFPENKGLVMALKERLETQGSMSSTERSLYEKIRSEALTQGSSNVKLSSKDNVLDIAVVLPFNYEGRSGVQSINSNNFVLQLYQGIKLALDQAKSNGVKLNFKTFDTERSDAKVRGILEDDFLSNADIIIGPLYPEETALVASFAQQRQIPQINPLSNIDENVKGFEYSYLFRPSIQAISQNVLDYCRKFEGKRVAIAYSGTSRDELLAATFVDMARISGLQIVKNQKVTTRDMQGFFESLELGKGKSQTADLMVIFSDDPNIASPTFGLVESLGAGLPVVVMESWLYFDFANYDMMETQNFHFVGNNTVDFNNELLDDFRNDYMNHYKINPSSFAYMGFELADFVTKVINEEKGFDFQKNLDRRSFIKGNLTFGFNFSRVRFNNYVPILSLEDGVLTIEE